MKYYDPIQNRLIFTHKQGTSEFWDKHWESEDLRTYIISCKTDAVFVPAVKWYLPAGSTVLEGGCGRGQLVHALQSHGYRSIGIDFAVKTVKAIKLADPDLHVMIGDVRNLMIADGELDGYISGGVIEHFWEGYEDIISEMARTIRNGGFLFVSFPYLSPLRRLKIRLGTYPQLKGNVRRINPEFYQFAFSAKKVQQDLEQIGFRLVKARAKSGLKGFKDEVELFKPFLQEVYDGKRGGRIVRYTLDTFFRVFAGHMIVLIMEKTSLQLSTAKNAGLDVIQ